MLRKSFFYLSLVFTAAVVASCCGGGTKKAEPVNVLTFNIRYDNPRDSLNSWQFRKENVANLIRFYSPDLMGTQEVLQNQLNDLNTALPDYVSYGVGREDGNTKGEYSAIFYKKDRFDFVKGATFWLSETPNEAGTKGWDAACSRVITWAELKDKETGKSLYFFNTHFDHVGEIARSESSKMLLDSVAAIAGTAPAIVTGDFNAIPSSTVVQAITNAADAKHLIDSRGISPVVFGPNFTYHGFDGFTGIATRPQNIIDYVFIKNNIKVLRHGVLAEKPDEKSCYSDHFPVLSTFVIE